MEAEGYQRILASVLNQSGMSSIPVSAGVIDLDTDIPPEQPAPTPIVPQGKHTVFNSDGEEEEKEKEKEKEEEKEEKEENVVTTVPVASAEATEGGMGSLFEESSAKSFSLFNFLSSAKDDLTPDKKAEEETGVDMVDEEGAGRDEEVGGISEGKEEIAGEK